MGVARSARLMGFDSQRLYRMRVRPLPSRLRADRDPYGAALHAFAEQTTARGLPGRFLADWSGWKDDKA